MRILAILGTRGRPGGTVRGMPRTLGILVALVASSLFVGPPAHAAVPWSGVLVVGPPCQQYVDAQHTLDNQAHADYEAHLRSLFAEAHHNVLAARESIARKDHRINRQAAEIRRLRAEVRKDALRTQGGGVSLP